jgi:hypothetical protein
VERGLPPPTQESVSGNQACGLIGVTASAISSTSPGGAAAAPRTGVSVDGDPMRDSAHVSAHSSFAGSPIRAASRSASVASASYPSTNPA